MTKIDTVLNPIGPSSPRFGKEPSAYRELQRVQSWAQKLTTALVLPYKAKHLTLPRHTVCIDHIQVRLSYPDF